MDDSKHKINTVPRIIDFSFNTQPFWNDCRRITASNTVNDAHVYFLFIRVFLCSAPIRKSHFEYIVWIRVCVREWISQSTVVGKDRAQPFQHGLISDVFFFFSLMHTCEVQRRCDDSAMEFKWPQTDRLADQNYSSIVCVGEISLTIGKKRWKHSGRERARIPPELSEGDRQTTITLPTIYDLLIIVRNTRHGSALHYENDTQTRS